MYCSFCKKEVSERCIHAQESCSYQRGKAAGGSGHGYNKNTSREIAKDAPPKSNPTTIKPKQK